MTNRTVDEKNDDLTAFLQRPDVVVREARALSARSRENDDEADRKEESAVRASIREESEKLEWIAYQNRKRMKELEIEANRFRDPALPVLTCMSTSLRKSISRIPKANDIVSSHVRSIETELNKRPSNIIYSRLRRNMIRRHNVPSASVRDDGDARLLSVIDGRLRGAQGSRTSVIERRSKRRSRGVNRELDRRTNKRTIRGRRGGSSNRKMMSIRQKAKELSSSKMEHQKLQATIVSEMSNIMQRLPRDLMKRATNNRVRFHHLNKLIMRMRGVISAFRRRCVARAMEKWKERTMWARQQARCAAACRIQRTWWRYVAIKEMNIRRELREAQDAEARRIFEMRSEAARTIQRAYRIRVAKTIVSVMREIRDRRTASASCVQRGFRCFHARVVLTRLRLQFERRQYAATCITKVVRGWRDRRRCIVLARVRRVREERRKRQEAAERMRSEFERHGAAMVLQLWYRGRLFRFKMKRTVRARRWRAAKVIQRRFRSYEIRKQYLRNRERIILIQRRARVLIAMQNLRYAKRRILEKKQDRSNRKRAILQEQQERVVVMGLNVSKKDVRLVKKALRNPIRAFVTNSSKTREQNALVVQCAFRQYAARSHVRRIKMRLRHRRRDRIRLRRIKAAVLVQKLYRGWQYRRDDTRRRVNAAANKIQVHWREWYRSRRFFAALRIQRTWKGVRCRRQFVVLKRARQLYASHVTKIAAVWRGYQARVRVRKKRERLRVMAKTIQKGAENARETKTRVMEMIVLESLRSKYALTRSDIQGVFLNISQKQLARSTSDEKSDTLKSRRTTQMNGSAFKMFYKGAKGLLRKSSSRSKERGAVLGFDMNELDLLFAKHKTKGQRMIRYRQLLSILTEIATSMYPNVKSYKAGSTGSEAQLYRFLDIHILNSDVVYASNPLVELERSAERRIEYKSRVIARAWLIHKGREIQSWASVAKEAYLRRKLEYNAAVRVQKRFRIRQARKKLVLALNRIFIKYIDSDTGQPFYVNKLTGAKSWFKPQLVRLSSTGDLDDTFELPNKDTEFVVYCTQCVNDDGSQKRADVCCEECEEALCSSCFEQFHQSGRRKHHVPTAIKKCGICEYQAATRKCIPCHTLNKEKGMLCDNCFVNKHKEHNHKWDPVIVMCSECNTYACRWWCYDCKDPFCTPCFERLHRRGRMAVHKIRPTPYFLMSIKRRHDRAKMERALESEKLRAVELQKSLDRAREIKAAIVLQSHWRSYVARLAGKERMRKERLWRRAEASRKTKQAELEKKLAYRVARAGNKFASGVHKAFHEFSNAEQLPGTVSLKPNRTRVKCTDDLSRLLVSGDRLRFDACPIFVTVKRVKTRVVVKKKKMGTKKEISCEIILTRPWDGRFDAKAIDATCVETDEDGDLKKLKSVRAYKLPKLNASQQAIASTVHTVENSAKNFASTMTTTVETVSKKMGELKRSNKTIQRIANATTKMVPFANASSETSKNDDVRNDEDESEWMEVLDEASGMPYYVNMKTNESVWEKPGPDKAVEKESKKALTPRRRGFLANMGRFLMRGSKKSNGTVNDEAISTEVSHQTDPTVILGIGGEETEEPAYNEASMYNNEGFLG